MKQRSRIKQVRERSFSLSYELDSCWIALIDPELAIPCGLSELGLLAARTIVEFVGNEGWTYSGHGNAFSTPAEFFRDDVRFTKKAELVVCHAEGLLDVVPWNGPTERRNTESTYRSA